MLIVGGGPVGSFFAALMAGVGYDVEVIDKRPDPREIDTQSGRSINLTMAERGLAALARLGVRDRVIGQSVPLYGRIIHLVDGSVSFSPYGDDGEAIYALRRHELAAILVEVAEQRGAKFSFRTSCQDVDLEAPAIRIKRGGGDAIERSASLLVAADGAYSTIRNRMQQRLRFFNYSQRYANLEYTEFLVPGDAAGLTRGRRNAVHVWPRGNFMLIGFPNRDGSMTMSLQVPREGPVSHASIRSPDDLETLFLDQFPDVIEDMRPVLEEYFERPTGTMITIRCSPWTLGDRVLLLGDACHAIFPSYGQGCNSSFDDCVVLHELICQAGDKPLAEVLRHYETLRKPEADAIADLSIAHFDVLNRAVADPDHRLARAIGLELHRRDPNLAPLYNNVSFTTMPYTEALRREANLRDLVQRVMTDVRANRRSVEEAVSRLLTSPLDEPE